MARKRSRRARLAHELTRRDPPCTACPFPTPLSFTCGYAPHHIGSLLHAPPPLLPVTPTMAPARALSVGFAVSSPLFTRSGCLASPSAALRPVVQRTWVSATSPLPSCRRCTPSTGASTPTTPTASASRVTSAPPVLTLNTGDDTTITVALPPSALAPLGLALNNLLASFKAVAAAAAEGKRDKQPVMEYLHEEEGLRVSMECNPNLHQSAFKATVYIKVASGGVVVASQSLLTRLVDNVKLFKSAVKAAEG